MPEASFTSCFWDWEVFNERFTIAEFSTNLTSNNRAAVVNQQSQRKVTGRTPLGTGELDDSLLQNGVLTINVNQHPLRVDQLNNVSIMDEGDGRLSVTWRGVGQRHL